MDLDAVAATRGPGLAGALMVGFAYGKALAWALSRPFLGIDHMEGHLFAPRLEGGDYRPPAVVLLASGGHSQIVHMPDWGHYEVLGATIDDAAGEAFDKIAKLLGLGFPGGPAVQKAAERGDARAIDFPRAMRDRGGFDFSFSGLKTAVRQYVEARPALSERDVADVAASAQAAIVDALVERTIACARAHAVRDVYLAGGVAANRPLRAAMQAACTERGIVYHAPLIEYCTDNGAMVARTAELLLAAGRNDGASLDVFTRGPITSWT
jgi:N6-L-threonylcarbamoyladenine synthase